MVEHECRGSGGVLGVAVAGEDDGQRGEPVDTAAGVAAAGGIDGLLGVGAGGGQVTEGLEGVGVPPQAWRRRSASG
jgi:hypothetical protein